MRNSSLFVVTVSVFCFSFYLVASECAWSKRAEDLGLAKNPPARLVKKWKALAAADQRNSRAETARIFVGHWPKPSGTYTFEDLRSAVDFNLFGQVWFLVKGGGVPVDAKDEATKRTSMFYVRSKLMEELLVDELGAARDIKDSKGLSPEDVRGAMLSEAELEALEAKLKKAAASLPRSGARKP